MNCIFCTKRRANSGEHLWPDAIAAEIERTWMLSSNDLQVNSFELVRTSGIVETKFSKRSGPRNREKVKAVCATCNNSWMNRSDERVLWVLQPLMRADPVLISPNDEVHLASWITMKLMVAEHRNPRSLSFHRSDWTHFYLTGLPPESVHISMGSCNDERWATGFHRQTANSKVDGVQGPRSAIVTWGIGRLIIYFEHSNPEFGWHDVPPALGRKVWPVDNMRDVFSPLFFAPAELVDLAATRYNRDFPSITEPDFRRVAEAQLFRR